jgi:hypothetical protein
VDEAQILALLEQVGEALTTKFVKQYSAGRLAQIMSHLETVKMGVSHLHDEESREEEQTRKDGVIQQLVLAGRPMSDARDAVERGER